MNKIMIFDFNRTIYDPDTEQLFPDTEQVLTALLDQGYSLILISFAPEEDPRRKLIERLGLNNFFSTIIYTPNKCENDFLSPMNIEQADPTKSYVVGDRVRSEIRIGNKLGLTTIWLRAGRFKNELPQKEEDEPTFVIKNLLEILEIVL